MGWKSTTLVMVLAVFKPFGVDGKEDLLSRYCTNPTLRVLTSQSSVLRLSLNILDTRSRYCQFVRIPVTDE